jgi:hypothetical protein
MVMVIFAVGMGDVEVPNPHKIEARCKTKWPPP